MTTLPIQTLKWGIFDVAYDIQGRHSSSHNISSSLFWTLPDLWIQLWRFLQDVLRIAPSTSITYFAATAWLGASSAISLQMLYSILQQIEILTSHPHVHNVVLHGQLISDICIWVLFMSLSVLMERLKDDKELLLCGHLRAYFLPSIVTASIKADVRFVHDENVRRYFPSSSSFGEGGPGWNLLKGLAERSQILVSLFSDLYVLNYVLSQRDLCDKWILVGCTGVFVAVRLLYPSNGVNGAGYTFWTTNSAFTRLHLLYTLIFSDKYRENLAKDGLGEFLSKEYHKCSRELGVVKSDVMTLACTLPPPWYWTALRSLMLDYPMVLWALPLMWISSPYIISTLIFFQFASNNLDRSIDSLKRSFYWGIISHLRSQTETLYGPIDQAEEIRQNAIAYSPSMRNEGMRLGLKDVVFRYPSMASDFDTMKKISLTIPANSFVLLVGENGSGKTTLLKLLARLLEPVSGEIFVDDHLLSSYDLSTIRHHTTFLMQSEEIYPTSLRENLLMAVPKYHRGAKEVDRRMDEAIRLGGAERLIERVSYDAVLNPPHILGQSLQGCGNGPVGPAAIRELEKHTLTTRVPISNGEKQRFLAARAFMRLLNSDTRLLMVDEPTSSLDVAAERNMFEEFYRKREGKTTIFVSHRFGSLAKRVDMILCMKDGQIVESGQHEELMALNGEYARLYEAQSSVDDT